ncbi:PAC2 family protein [Candidatus Woesearchaeota archaeon]|nr:PAC2 family protein [Candidatus Woesearchaeota archaeon]MBW3014615.1 PAC2 family protein [Candidatus Woesearchaeota archaeon]
MVNTAGKQKNNWEFKRIGVVPKMKSVVFIEGLPGIGNVGKIAVDFIIENKKAKMIYEIFSYDLPHSVFVQEDNLVELPKLHLYHVKIGKQDFVFLSGDVQPLSERSCYEFCESLLDVLEKLDVKQIVTLGGIGLGKLPKKPTVFSTGNDQKLIKEFKKKNKDINTNPYGVIGPVVGVTGLLVGLAGKRKMPGIALLAETFAHPMYLGMKGARAMLNVLNNQFSFKLSMKDLDKEITDIEYELILKTKDMKGAVKGMKDKSLNYIG